MSNTYSTASFFAGRNVAALPLDLFIPALFLVIFYWPVHLTNTAKCFFWALFISELVYWMSASYGLLLSALFKDITVVMALVPVIIVPLMLVGGFFTNLRNVPKLFYPLEYISMFMYGWQAYIQNNFRDGTTCPDGVHCDILAVKYNFRVTLSCHLGTLLGQPVLDVHHRPSYEGARLCRFVLLEQPQESPLGIQEKC